MERVKKKQKKEKGITLIALVITIVILLILAGISVRSLIGNNGLIKNVRKSKRRYRNCKRKRSN